ncbi:hypothetical protein Tco_1306815 [Tanacetum coccineum]
MSFLTSLYSPGNIMDEVAIDNLTIEQYLRLTQESQTPKKIEDMTTTEYLEYEKKVNENHISNTKSYLPTYFGKSILTHDLIREFAHYFGTESDCDSEDIEEEVEYIIDDEVVMSEEEESNHGYTRNIQHFKEKDDVDEWLNVEITKHMSMKGVENIKDDLIIIIKSIRHEMKDGIMIRQVEASIACVSDEVSSIASNEVDKDDDNTSNTAPYAKDNIMLLKVYKYLGLDKFRGARTIENNTGTDEPLRTIDIVYVENIYMVDIGQEEETFNPLEIGINLFSYESPACLEFEQRTRSYGTPNPQEEIAEPISFSPDRRGLVKRWHVCKPVHVNYDDGCSEDCGMWLTCDLDSKFCFGYNEVFGVNEQGTLRMWICFRDHERRTVKGSYMRFVDFFQILDSYNVEEEYAREIGNPYSRRFDEYKRVFNNEIEHFSNKYILRIEKKGYVLDDVWEKCQQNYKKTNEAWHDEGYEEDEMWRSGDEKTDYDPPYVNDEALPLGRVNGTRFKAMIRKELEGNKYVHEVT